MLLTLGGPTPTSPLLPRLGSPSSRPALTPPLPINIIRSLPRSTVQLCSACSSPSPTSPPVTTSSSPTSVGLLDLDERPIRWGSLAREDDGLGVDGLAGRAGGSAEGKERLKESKGLDTTTKFLTVQTTAFVPWTVTEETTWGVVETEAAGTTVVISVYTDASTTITLTPQIVWQTVYPTTTELTTATITESSTTYAVTTQVQTQYSTSTVQSTASSQGTLPTTPPSSSPTSTRPSTTTKSSTQSATPTTSPVRLNTCQPGDSHQTDGPGLSLNRDRTVTIYVIAIYIVGITIAWNMVFVHKLLIAFTSLTVAYHELGHVIAYILHGQRIVAVNIDPGLGGATVAGPPDYVPSPDILFAGYTFSIIIGGLLTFCGFSTLPSKIASFIIGLSFLPILWFQKKIFARVMVLASIGLMIGLWFIDHAQGLRFYVLFVGVMNSWYIIFDTNDDFFHNKRFACCAVMIASYSPGTTGFQWYIFWLVVSFLVFVAFIIAGLGTWRQTVHGMYCLGQSFLPT